jgi:anaerobic magnesium-protoporphyrin IX monomethyl ester cyclase|tara:strand:- start:685 stop:2229 length:1545 start_codon:yes stop_codon:yes gene_type:complete
MGEKTKICLIMPPSPFLLDERVFMSLGILTIAAVLEEKGYLVDMMDLSGIKNYLEALETYISNNPDVNTYCLTATTPQLPLVKNINDHIKETGRRVIVGGPHFTLINSAHKKEKQRGVTGRATRALEKLKETFHTIVCGDGELAVFRALDGERFVDADDRKSELFLSNSGFTATPFPARHLVDVDSYNFHIEGKKGLSLIGQLGCPFMCGFCSGRNSPTFRKIRTRTVENIIEEISLMHKTWGIEAFTFYDDELNVTKTLPDLLRRIIDYQRENNTTFNLRGCIKSELFNEEQAELMYAAGFKKLLVGFESGAPRILDNINKRATVEDNTKCIELGRKYGIELKALMSIGHPGESEQTIKETELWLKDVAPEEFDVTIITVIPGSPYYDDAYMVLPNKKGHVAADHDIKPNDRVWAFEAPRTKDRLYSLEVDNLNEFEYYKGIPGEYNAFVFTDYLSRKDLVKYRDYLDKEVTSYLGHTRNTSVEAKLYEHSMGMLPNFILRSSEEQDCKNLGV